MAKRQPNSRKGPGPKKRATRRVQAGPAQPKPPVTYEHREERLLLRPDVRLQAQFRSKKAPKTYRYDRSLDALSWDINADRERAEALIASIEQAGDLGEAKAAAAALRRMSRPFLNWAGKAEHQELSVPTLPLFVHERLSTQRKSPRSMVCPSN